MDDVLWLCCAPWYQYINMRNTDFHTTDVTTNTRNGHVTPKLGFLKAGFFQQMRGRPPSAILGCNGRPLFSSKPTMNTVPFIFDRSPLSCNFGVFFVVSHVFPPKNNHRSWTPHVVGGLGFFILVQVDVSENSGFSPQIIHFNRVFHYFHHPFWGVSLFLETPMSTWVGPGSSEVGKVEDLQNNEVLQVGVFRHRKFQVGCIYCG